MIWQLPSFQCTKTKKHASYGPDNSTGKKRAQSVTNITFHLNQINNTHHLTASSVGSHGATHNDEYLQG